MFTLRNFCFFCDLRRGCIVYAWLQMMIVTILGTKFSYIHHSIPYYFDSHYSEFIFLTVNLGIMIGMQLVKGASSAALIWGIVKKNHMFYQPWLFVNGAENCILLLATGANFIIGCMDPVFFRALPVFAVLTVYGWYVWACVFVVYKRDMKPNLVTFNDQYENFNMNNINVTV